MKKYILVVLLGILVVLTGCSFKKNDDALKEVSNKVEKLKTYYLSGQMELFNNETTYKYDVKVSYSKDNNFKVVLKNKANDHEQVVLRNEEGVYIITPSLNKSFKFQSDWPYNNSQSYLLQNIVKDLKSDEKVSFIKDNNNYIYTSKVNYSNNKDLIKQKVTIDNEYNIKQIEVLDSNDIVKIKMVIDEIDYSPRFSNEYFTLESNVLNDIEESTEVTKVEDIMYPMYIPSNTTLSSQDKINNDDYERIILTFGGDSSFTLIEEPVNISSEFTTIPINGDLVVLGGTLGVLDDSSVTWISENIQYYLVSKDLSSEELVEVARSIGGVPVLK